MQLPPSPSINEYICRTNDDVCTANLRAAAGTFAAPTGAFAPPSGTFAVPTGIWAGDQGHQEPKGTKEECTTATGIQQRSFAAWLIQSLLLMMPRWKFLGFNRRTGAFMKDPRSGWDVYIVAFKQSMPRLFRQDDRTKVSRICGVVGHMGMSWGLSQKVMLSFGNTKARNQRVQDFDFHLIFSQMKCCLTSEESAHA